MSSSKAGKYESELVFDMVDGPDIMAVMAVASPQCYAPGGLIDSDNSYGAVRWNKGRAEIGAMEDVDALGGVLIVGERMTSKAKIVWEKNVYRSRKRVVSCEFDGCAGQRVAVGRMRDDGRNMQCDGTCKIMFESPITGRRTVV